jgi:hypothetical protein
LDKNDFSGPIPPVPLTTLEYCTTQSNPKLLCTPASLFCCYSVFSNNQPTVQANQTPRQQIPNGNTMSTATMVILVSGIAFASLVSMVAVTKVWNFLRSRRDLSKFKPFVVAVPSGSDPADFEEIKL